MTSGWSRIGLALALPALVIPGWALAFGYEDALSSYGTLFPGVSPSSVAFGGARSVGLGDPSAVFLNPADLSRISSDAFLACGGPGIGHEAVDVPSGRTDRSYIGIGPTAACFRLNAGQRAGFAGGIARVSDFSYDALQYISDDSLHPGDITYSESFESSGGLWEVVGGGGWRFMRRMSVGASIGARFGSADIEYIYDDRVGEEDTMYTSNWEESALCAHLGTSVVFGLNSIGISYATSSDHYPDVLSCGAMLYSAGESGGIIGFEGEVSDLSDAQHFTGKLFGSISPESSFTMRGSLFFGSRGVSSEKRSLMGFALGVAVDLGKATLEGSFSTTRMAREEGGAFGLEQIEKIVDTAALVSLGLAYTF